MVGSTRVGRPSVGLLGLGGLLTLLGCAGQSAPSGEGEGTGQAEQASEQGAAAELGPNGRTRAGNPQKVAPAADGRVARYVVLDGPGAIASLGGSDVRTTDARQRLAARVAELRGRHGLLRPALEAAGAQIIADVVLVGNAFQIRVAPDRLRSIERLPGVARLGIPSVLTPSLDVAVPLVGAPGAWESGTGYRGEGMRIGVIDTGIDYLHADLGGAGVAADYQADDHAAVEPGSFPTTKVTGGVDLAGDDYDGNGLEGSATPTPDDDPIDCNGHGTHVSGIAAGTGVLTDGSPYAGPWDSSLDPASFAVSPGVAPAASLYAIKIFGCAGSTDLLLPALELAADPDGDGDVSDRLDVVNASLGTDFALGTDAVEAEAVASLTAAGSLFVAAAGNAGGDTRAHFAVGSPGSLPQALSVAASFKEAGAVSRLALEVTAPGSVAGTYPVGGTEPEPNISTLTTISGQAVLAEPVLACEPLTNGAALAGNLALVERGTCPFNTKAQMAADVGATGLLIVNNAFSELPTHPFNGSGGHAIPMWSLRRADGLALMEAAPLTVSITEGVTTEVTLGPDNVWHVSSRGPTADHLLVKPDLSAPGFNLLSALVGSGSESVPASGTSMATPLVTGAAALMRQARPALGPLEVKELLTSTGRPVTNALGEPFPTTLAGSGRLAIDEALGAEIAARVDGRPGETGASFGVVLATSARTESRTVIVTNHGAAAAELDVAVEPALEWPGASVAVSPAQVTVPAGGTATVELTLTVDPTALPVAPTYDPFTNPLSAPFLDGTTVDIPSTYLTEASGVLRLSPSGSSNAVARVAYHGVVRAAAERSVGDVTGCLSGAGTGLATLALEGTAATHDNATSVLELGTEASSFDDPSGPDGSRDIVAVGALADPETERVFFGVVTAADWVTPAKGWSSEVGFEVDTNADQTPDFLVVAESFRQPDPANWKVTYQSSAPFARVLNLTTGELSQTYQPLNSAMAAYPGGMFFAGDPPDTYETHVYFNRVLVFPVELAALGLDSTDGAFSYRGVSNVSRWPQAAGLPAEPPLDTTDWVAFDAAAPRLALPDCFYGTPLCPGDASSITLGLPGDTASLPTLLVLHHGNGPEPSYETVELAAAALESSDLSVTASAGGSLMVGESASVTFTVTNDSGSAREGVTVSIAVTGGAIDTLDASAGSCTGSACDLGALASGALATVTVAASAAAEGTLALTATAASTSGCDTDATNDEASANYAVTEEPTEPPAPVAPVAADEDSGCGCRLASEPRGGGWAAALSLMLSGLAVRRRTRRARRG